jgi:putative CocE/NonD family hydrolase
MSAAGIQYVAIIVHIAAIVLAAPRQMGAQAGAGPVPRPPGKYAVALEKSLWVPMRDGVRLSTDVYRPVGVADRLAVILIRTPYDKRRYRRLNPDSSEAAFFAAHGYAVVVQDTRGRFESEGEFTISYPDVADGHDAIDWASRQRWSNGKVGGYGCSYVGDTQLMAAKSLHPAYAAMIPQSAASSWPHRGFLHSAGGAIDLSISLSWFASSGSKLRYLPPPGTSSEMLAKHGDFFSILPNVPFDVSREVWGLPLIDILDRAGVPPTDWKNVLTHGPDDPWWVRLGYFTDKDRFDTPALQIESWFDTGVAVSLDQFNFLRTHSVSQRARDNQFMIVSPTLHCLSEEATASTIVGRRNMGDPRRDFWRIYLDWFDFWLRAVDNRVTSMPKLQYYLMGKNEWRSADAWPIPGTEFTRFFLHSGGRANSRFGDGVLSLVAPGAEPADSYTYDPAIPVPSRGLACCMGLPRGALDQSEVEARADVLVYTTEPLEQGIEVTGPISLELHASSSARDTDFTAKLVDVFPDGTAFNVQEGILRARYRDGWSKRVWMQPGQVVRLPISLEATGHYFAKGHRIRLEVSSSNFPRFDRNLNTGGNNYDETAWVVARNTVHHSSRYPSYLLLPIVPARPAP